MKIGGFAKKFQRIVYKNKFTLKNQIHVHNLLFMWHLNKDHQMTSQKQAKKKQLVEQQHNPCFSMISLVYSNKYFNCNYSPILRVMGIFKIFKKWRKNNIASCSIFAIWVITTILQFANLQMGGGPPLWIHRIQKPEVILRVIVSINDTWIQ